MSTIPYTVLVAKASTATANDGKGGQLPNQGMPVLSVLCSTTKQQVPLVCSSQLTGPPAAGVVTAGDTTGLAYCYKLTPRATAEAVSGPASAAQAPRACTSRRVTLQGATQSSKWQDVRVQAASATVYRPMWQLQQSCRVPLLQTTWQQHPLLAGTFTASALLLDWTSQHSTHQHNVQQLLQLQQLMAAACTAVTAAASAAEVHSHPGGNRNAQPRSSSSVVQDLAAAAAALLLHGTSCTQPSAAGACISPAEPIYCSTRLLACLSAAFKQQAQHGIPSSSRISSSSIMQNTSGTADPPPCLVCAATSSGQVWVCDPMQLLQQQLQDQHSSVHLQQGHQQGLHQQQQQDQQWQGQQQDQQQWLLRSVVLVLDMQQPVVAVLPVGSSSGSPGLLLVGGLGRLLLLQPQERRRQQQQAQGEGQQQQQAHACQDHSSSKLAASQQLQLSFQVAAATVLSCASNSMQQQQRQTGSSKAPSLLLLLLTTSGRLYAADLGGICLQQTAGEVEEPPRLNLQLVHIPLPAAVTRVWTIPQQQQQQPQQQQSQQPQQQQQQQEGYRGSNQGSTRPDAVFHSGTGAAVKSPAGEATAAGISADSIVVQLDNSMQLLHLPAHGLQATVEAAASDDAVPSASTGVVGEPGAGPPAGAAAGVAAATAARSRLQEMMAALETIAAAREQLEQAGAQQQLRLQGIQDDLALLQLLQQGSTRVPSPAAADAAGGGGGGGSGRTAGGQSYMEAAARGTSSGSSSSSSNSTGLCCSVQPHGLWPVLGTSLGRPSPSSSIYMAATLKLQQQEQQQQLNSHSRSGLGSSVGRHGHLSSRSKFRGVLGPGWQLVVSFVPESDDSSSVQTTVGVSSSSSSSAEGALHVSLLLPLPEACAGLQEGGWVLVYAVKDTQLGASTPVINTAAAAAAAAGFQQGPAQQQQQQQGRHQLPPVVALLGQQYISVLQLSAMAAANPAVEPLTRAASSRPCRPAPTSTSAASSSNGGSTGTSALYSCMMHLLAAGGVVAGGETGACMPAAALGGIGDGGGVAVKRARTETAAVPPAAPSHHQQQQQDQQQQQQQQGDDVARQGADQGGAALLVEQQQQHIQVLQAWLGKALGVCTAAAADAAPALPFAGAQWCFSGAVSTSSSVALPGLMSHSWLAGLGSDLTHHGSGGSSSHGNGSGSGSRPAWGLASGGAPGFRVPRQGQALFSLAASQTAKVSWAFSCDADPPSAQLVDVAAGLMAPGIKRPTVAAAAGEGAGVGSGAVAGGGNSSAGQLSLQLQSGSVTSLASVHRALLLEVLWQLEASDGSSTAVDVSSSGSSSAGGAAGSSGSSRWHMVSSVPQLKKALARLRQLQQHVIRLQAEADRARSMYQALSSHTAAATPGAAGGGGVDAAGGGGVGDASVAGQMAIGRPHHHSSGTEAALMGLASAMEVLEHGILAAYGRFLLAVSEAVQVAV